MALEKVFDIIDTLKGRYSKEQIKQLSIIIRRYQAHINPDESKLAATLKLKPGEDKPRAEIYYEDLQPYTWNYQLGDGHLRHLAEELYASITNYQILRFRTLSNTIKETILGNTLNEPIGLFLEEFKLWLINDLSKKSLDEKLLQEVQARVGYLHSMLSDHTMLPVNEKLTRTGQQVLNEVKKYLEYDCTYKINLAISRRTSRDNFDALLKHTERAIKEGIKYLSCIFSPWQEEYNFTMSEIINPRMDSNKKIMKTIAGQLLQLLLTSPQLLTLFEITHHTKNAQHSHAVIEFEGLEVTQNSFMHNATLIFPSTLIKLDPEQYKLSNWFQHRDSGILPAFQNPELMQEFLKLHALIQHLANFRLLVEDVYDIAGDGGDILVYGFAKPYLKMLIKVCGHLLIEMDSVVAEIHDAAEAHCERVRAKKTKEKADISWFNGYASHVSQVGISFENSLNDCNRDIERIAAALKQISLKDRLTQAARKLKIFSTKVTQFTRLTNSLLGCGISTIFARDIPNLLDFMPQEMPDKPRDIKLDIDAMIKAILLLVENGDFEGALAHLTHLIEEHKVTDPGILFYRAKLFFCLNFYQDALEQINVILESNPDRKDIIDYKLKVIGKINDEMKISTSKECR